MYLECRHCSVFKPKADFPIPPGKQCKACRKKTATKRALALKAAGMCSIHKAAPIYRWGLCKKCVEYRQERQQVKVWKRQGINFSEEKYRDLLEKQQGLCAVCSEPPKMGGRRLAVEHCHKTGRIRGLVHFRCNLAIALYEEGLMQKIEPYLKPWAVL